MHDIGSAQADQYMDSAAYEQAQQSLIQHYRSFQHLVALAEYCAARHHPVSAATFAQIAADYAWTNHTGVFTNDRLEQLLVNIGSNLVLQTKAKVKRKSQHERVLHVITQALDFGGHARLACRWAIHDTARHHSFCLTKQEIPRVPAFLHDTRSACGGQLYLLDRAPGNLITRARHLLKIAMEYDYVVLHTHPYDVIPSLAFARKDASHPPVIFLNHADHVFWLGVAAGDVFAHLRPSGAALSTHCRTIPQEASGFLPIPLDLTQRTLTRTQAKQILGLPADSIILLSVASPYKYTQLSTTSLHFVDLVTPILARYPTTILMVAGPMPSGAWDIDRHPLQVAGRIRALGRIADLSVLYQAADVYLDSFPLGSDTSSLEAGSYGTPLLSYVPYLNEAAVLGSEAIGLSATMLYATTLEQYRSHLLQLITNSDYRQDLGEQTQQRIRCTHFGADWQAALNHLYHQARTRAAMPRRYTEIDYTYSRQLNTLLSCVMSNSGTKRGLCEIVQWHVRLFPFLLRASLTHKLWRCGRHISKGMLLPEWLGNAYEKIVRQERYQ